MGYCSKYKKSFHVIEYCLTFNLVFSKTVVIDSAQCITGSILQDIQHDLTMHKLYDGTLYISMAMSNWLYKTATALVYSHKTKKSLQFSRNQWQFSRKPGGTKLLNMPTIFEKTHVLDIYSGVSVDSRCFSRESGARGPREGRQLFQSWKA